MFESFLSLLPAGKLYCIYLNSGCLLFTRLLDHNALGEQAPDRWILMRKTAWPLSSLVCCHLDCCQRLGFQGMPLSPTEVIMPLITIIKDEQMSVLRVDRFRAHVQKRQAGTHSCACARTNAHSIAERTKNFSLRVFCTCVWKIKATYKTTSIRLY